MKRIVLTFLGIAAAAFFAIVGIEILAEPGSDAVGEPVADAAAQAAQTGRGAYLARVGNCMGCHTARGGAAYAGGRAITTPFGNIYSSNITPDPTTGIGAWSSNDFWRAIHNGKAKNGSFLYPAFPYPNYTKITRTDADALYAFLKTLAPVKQANREHELRFPYNHRILLAFWRRLYFTPREFRPQPERGPEWNRGAYLVQGLGHCSACHTARNALGGTTDKGDLAGGMIPMQSWYASSLTSDAVTGLGAWRETDVEQLLKNGVSRRGAVFGPMAEVVSRSLQHLSDADIHAMAVYLKALPGTNAPPVETVEATESRDAVLKRGAALYGKHCAACHGDEGGGAPPAYPALAGTRSLLAHSPVNPIRIVLNGGYPPSTNGNPRPYGMPPFGAALNDEDIAAVVSYIRNAWGNRGELASPVEVARSRGAPID